MARLKIIPKKPASKAAAPATPASVKVDAQKDREAWLIAAVKHLAPLFKQGGVDSIPEVRVSVGWGGGRGGKKVLGKCWNKEASEDGTYQIFISPMISGSVDALACLVHELCHACTDCTGHSKPFVALARAVGLDGKATATFPSERLVLAFNEVIHKHLGTYPHAKLNPEESGEKKQTTRMVKCVCPSSGYSCRTTREWLKKFGAPVSPATKLPMEFDQSVLDDENAAGEEGAE